MTPDDVLALLKAIEGKAWMAVAAILIGFLIRLSKTVIFGRVWDKIPMRYRFLVPIFLGVLSGVGEALSRGTSWVPALIYGLLAGVLAIGGDKVTTQNMPELMQPFEKIPAAPPTPKV